MKFNEEEFLLKVNSLYNGEIEVVSRFKGLMNPVLVKDKYGVMRLPKARQVLLNRPGIKAALNLTLYFMSKLQQTYPEIAEFITPESEYVTAKQDMLFNTKYGLVKTSPDTLLAGHKPGILSAVNRKQYFKKQLLEIYGDTYKFKITSTDRHKGRVTLICPIHGELSVDTDGIFLGHGCPECFCSTIKSNLVYFIRLYSDSESFYKIGIAHYEQNSTEIKRFKDYIRMGYNYEIIKIIEFNDFVKARELETKIKLLIKPFLINPKNWTNPTSTECFTNDLVDKVIQILNNDIVSTSTEMLSSESGCELANRTEEIEI